jgi:hypothetical protein
MSVRENILDKYFPFMLIIIGSDFIAMFIIQFGILFGLIIGVAVNVLCIIFGYLIAKWPIKPKAPEIDGYAPPGEKIGKFKVKTESETYYVTHINEIDNELEK